MNKTSEAKHGFFQAVCRATSKTRARKSVAFEDQTLVPG